MKKKWPDFIIIGAPKAGTTAFYRALGRHPEIFTPSLKEPGFFGYSGQAVSWPCPGGRQKARELVRCEQKYSRLFAECTPDARAGEASMNYFLEAAAPINVGKYAPEAKLIAILRNPVERAYSQWQHMRMRGWEPLENFDQALAAEEDRMKKGWRPAWAYAANSRYGTNLERWLSIAPKENLLILFYEDWCAEPQTVLRRACQHTGVRETAALKVTRDNVTSVSPRWIWLHRQLTFASTPRKIAQSLLPLWIRDLFTDNVTRKINKMNLRKAPSISPDVLRKYTPHFLHEVEIVERLTGRTLDRWK
jgi:hypothetical protein